MDIINYYLEKSEVILNKNSFIFIDKENKFQDDNPSLHINEGFYLLDNNYDVIIFGDPIDSDNVRKVYCKLNLL